MRDEVEDSAKRGRRVKGEETEGGRAHTTPSQEDSAGRWRKEDEVGKELLGLGLGLDKRKNRPGRVSRTRRARVRRQMGADKGSTCEGSKAAGGIKDDGGRERAKQRKTTTTRGEYEPDKQGDKKARTAETRTTVKTVKTVKSNGDKTKEQGQT